MAGTDASALQARVLWRDADILILDKPAGLAVHRAPGVRLSLEDFFDDLRFDAAERPGLAHRLDRDTSGVLVLGRHAEALRALNELFARNAVAKTYWAVIEGRLNGEGRFDKPLRRVRRDGEWLIVADKGGPGKSGPGKGGQAAETGYRCLGQSADNRTWLELKPRTGRTHQIRVHCADAKHPVVGDRRYGFPGGPGETLHLHARAVAFPWKGATIRAEAVPPLHMLPALKDCGFRP